MELSACLNSSNNKGICSFSIPIPVSATTNLRRSSVSLIFLSSSILITTSPDDVNFIALLQKLVITCPILKGSPISILGISESILMTNSKFFSRANCALSIITEFITISMSNGTFSNCILPTSIFEKSSISLIRLSIVFADLSIFCR